MPVVEDLRAELAVREGTSDQVYKLWIACGQEREAWNLHYLCGRRGTMLTGGLKTSRPVTLSSARTLFFSILRQKLNKGFRFVAIGGANPELQQLFATYGPVPAPLSINVAAAKKLVAKSLKMRSLGEITPPPGTKTGETPKLRVPFRPRPQEPARPQGFTPAAGRKIILEDD